MFVAPVVIMPLFNKFVPLDEGELKKAIQSLSAKDEDDMDMGDFDGMGDEF